MFFWDARSFSCFWGYLLGTYVCGRRRQRNSLGTYVRGGGIHVMEEERKFLRKRVSSTKFVKSLKDSSCVFDWPNVCLGQSKICRGHVFLLGSLRLISPGSCYLLGSLFWPFDLPELNFWVTVLKRFDLPELIFWVTVLKQFDLPKH